jgi:hypothetical protein
MSTPKYEAAYYAERAGSAVAWKPNGEVSKKLRAIHLVCPASSCRGFLNSKGAVLVSWCDLLEPSGAGNA